MTTSEGESYGGSSLAATATSGVIWSAAQKWVLRLSGFVTVAILTRLLTPADFGTVTVVMSILPLVYLLADMGFGTYIMQSPDAGPRTLNTVFWYSTTAGVVLTAALVLGAPLIGSALGVPGAAIVIYGIAPLIVIVTVGSVPNALLRNRMRFQLLAVQTVVATVISQIAAIILAVLGFGVWALVVQSVTAQLIATIFAWVASRWRPRFMFSLSEFRQIFRFGSHVVGVELVSLLRYWAENIIIVSALGVTGLGYLNIAQRLIQVAQDLTAAAILPVSTVVFAKVRNTVDRMRSGYFRALGITYATVIPIMMFIVVGAPQLVPLIFGSQWGPSVVPTQALAVAGTLTIGAMLDQGLFYGAGRPGRWFFYALAIDGLTVAVTLLLVQYGLVATSIGFIGVALVATVVRWALVGRLVEASWFAVAKPFLHASVPALASVAAGLGVGWLARGLPPIVILLFVGCAVLSVHLAVTRFVMPGEFDELRQLFLRGVRKLRRHGLPVRASTPEAAAAAAEAAAATEGVVDVVEGTEPEAPLSPSGRKPEEEGAR